MLTEIDPIRSRAGDIPRWQRELTRHTTARKTDTPSEFDTMVNECRRILDLIQENALSGRIHTRDLRTLNQRANRFLGNIHNAVFQDGSLLIGDSVVEAAVRRYREALDRLGE